jgi:hypothetical protein
MSFFEKHAVNHRTEQVVLDLMDDIYAVTLLTPYPVNDGAGALLLLVDDSHGGTYRVTNSEGTDLPDGYSIGLEHDQRTQGGDLTTLLEVLCDDGTIIQRAEMNRLVCETINARQLIVKGGSFVKTHLPDRHSGLLVLQTLEDQLPFMGLERSA